MRSFTSYLATVFGLALFVVAFYTACSNSVPVTPDFMACSRPARYPTLADIEKQRIALWADYVKERSLVLTTEQQTKLELTGDLVGEFELDRPVKFPNKKVDMPQDWLSDLPADHPWAEAPTATDDSFPAWLEVRIIDPLLYDPSSTTHADWAQAYLEKTAALTDGMVTSYIGADSSCP